MNYLFAPYSGKNPAPVIINGHRLLILSNDRDEIESNLTYFGGDHLERIDGGDTAEEQEVVLHELAQSVKGGIVVAPSEVGLAEIISNLESQLPWLN